MNTPTRPARSTITRVGSLSLIHICGEIKFACVDGPDFDGHLVDFDESMRRSAMYKKQEAHAVEAHECNLHKMEVK